MSDLIDRQEAIDTFNTNLNGLVVGGEENAKTVENYLNGVIEKIKCLPSAETEHATCYLDSPCEYQNINIALSSAEPKRGKWTNDASCPFCGFQPWYERDIHTLSFCPNCGADMRGEKDGE